MAGDKGGTRRAETSSGWRSPKQAALLQIVSDVLLARFAPAAVLMNQNVEVILVVGPTSKYVNALATRYPHDMSSLIPTFLHDGIKAAVRGARRDGKPFVVPDVMALQGAEAMMVDILVEPLSVEKNDFYLVCFVERQAPSVARSLDGTGGVTAAEVTPKKIHSETGFHGALQRRSARQTLAKLTARQRQILDQIILGYPNRLIASELGLSRRTVEAHRAALMKRTGSRSLSDLLRLVLNAEEKT